MFTIVCYMALFTTYIICLYFLDVKTKQCKEQKERIKQLEQIKDTLEKLYNNARIAKEFSKSSSVPAVSINSRLSLDLHHLETVYIQESKDNLKHSIKCSLADKMLDELMSCGRLETQFNIDQNTYDFLYKLKVIPTSSHFTFEGSMKEIEDYIKGAKNNE